MPRIARIAVLGIPHHVTQRGNNHEVIFFDDDDRRRYLEWLRGYINHYGVVVWAYCLMNNHIHLVAVPQKIDSLSNALRDAHMRYAQYINRRYNRCGHLWQGRFFSCALDEVHLLAAVRYVERNPVRAGQVMQAEEWPWSSAPAHIMSRSDGLLSGDTALISLVKDWKKFLRESDDIKTLAQLRRNTMAGRPFGSSEFIRRIEGLISRVLHSQKPGRPKKITIIK